MTGTVALCLSASAELRRKLADHIAIKPNKVRRTKAVEDREQQQRVFGVAHQALQLVRSSRRVARQQPWSRSRVPFDVHERGYKRHLQLDLFAPQSRVTGKVAIWSRARVS